MSLPSNQLDAFHAVARCLSFTKAAARLNVTQSALSQRILNLEQDLEITLFIRDRAGLTLTAAAHDLLRYCQTREGLETEFLANLKSDSRTKLVGTIRIAAYSSVLRSIIMPIFSKLILTHPALNVEFLVREADDLLSILKRGEVDFIVSDVNYDRDELVSAQIGKEKNVLVEGKKYQGKEVYLDTNERDETTFNYFRMIKKSSAKIHRRYVDDVYGIIDGVRLGYGRAVVARHLVEGESELVIVNPRSVLEVPLYLHYFRQPFYPKIHQVISELILKRAPDFLK
jgi:DNA-binding transcriptional LysR family regulator